MSDLVFEVRKPTDAEKVACAKWSTWSKEVCEFDWYFDQIEQCLFIEGEVDVVTDSKTYNIKAGDYVEFPKGLKCVWKVKKPLKKYYNLI